MKLSCQKVLGSFNHSKRCEWCGKVLPLQRHHYIARGMGGGRQLDVCINIVLLCAEHHAEAHNGGMRRQIALVLAIRFETSVEAIDEAIYTILRLPKSDKIPRNRDMIGVSTEAKRLVRLAVKDFYERKGS